jgi:hypothetical protein
MEQWSNVVASRIATTMPRKEEFVIDIAHPKRCSFRGIYLLCPGEARGLSQTSLKCSSINANNTQKVADAIPAMTEFVSTVSNLFFYQIAVVTVTTKITTI